jgi:hypothetical protein
VLGVQFPLQSCRPAGHCPLQGALIGMQAPAHSLVPSGQTLPHLAPSHMAPPPVGASHGVQEVPQCLTSPSATQTSPQRWNPGLHLRSHLSPSQVVSPLAEVGQGVHEVPHALRLLVSTQMPLHAFWPAGQVPSQAAFWSTHLSRQGFDPAGQRTLHLMPSQAAEPPWGAGHGVHRLPQVRGESLRTHASAQVC